MEDHPENNHGWKTDNNGLPDVSQLNAPEDRWKETEGWKETDPIWKEPDPDWKGPEGSNGWKQIDGWKETQCGWKQASDWKGAGWDDGGKPDEWNKSLPEFDKSLPVFDSPFTNLSSFGPSFTASPGSLSPDQFGMSTGNIYAPPVQPDYQTTFQPTFQPTFYQSPPSHQPRLTYQSPSCQSPSFPSPSPVYYQAAYGPEFSVYSHNFSCPPYLEGVEAQVCGTPVSVPSTFFHRDRRRSRKRVRGLCVQCIEEFCVSYPD